MPNIEEIKKDIEKRMIALGYEDFEELHGPDHDTKSLAVLKRRLMDEAREMRELKKLKSRIPKGLKDVISKLSKIYKYDFYIYNGKFIIPGNKSEEVLKSKFVVIMKDEFLEFTECISPKNNTMILVEDISELRHLIDVHPQNAELIYEHGESSGVLKVVDTETTTKLKNKIDEELEYIKLDSPHYIPAIIPDDVDPDIISFKKKFELKYKEFPEIESNIHLFPLYTDKEKPIIEFMSDVYLENSNMTLYYARFHMYHTYFEVCFKIFYF